MPRGFIKEGLSNLFQGQGTDHGAVVPEEGTEMTIKIKTIRREVVAGVWTGMSVTRIVEGTETIVVGAGVAVPVLITLEDGVEDVMMMSGGVAVDQLIVHPLLDVVQALKGVLPPARILPLRLKARIDVVVMIVPQLHEVPRLEVDMPPLVAHPLEIQMLMNELAGCMGNFMET